jgi:hypothetical protein
MTTKVGFSLPMRIGIDLNNANFPLHGSPSPHGEGAGG